MPRCCAPAEPASQCCQHPQTDAAAFLPTCGAARGASTHAHSSAPACTRLSPVNIVLHASTVLCRSQEVTSGFIECMLPISNLPLYPERRCRRCLQHTDFAEAKLQKRLFTSNLDEQEVDQLAVMAMSGVAAEAMQFDQVCASGTSLAGSSCLQAVIFPSLELACRSS